MNAQDITKEINNAIGAHGAWKLRLKTAVQTGSSQATPQQVRCDKSCAFGTWLHDDKIDDRTKGGMPYRVIKRLHAEFHDCASRVIAHASAGRKSEAANLLDGEFAQRSERLTVALNKWRSELGRR